ncbi:helix-turn-helix domain-containing protein [Streptomyces sp. NL15-2K]|uniref:helix-turn-helix domain-containing protein n=1 Tax=Streptomyces sp. NL15-2K TaxID=376149 RepID=UPI000FF9161E|nr:MULTISPECIES: helix-turn-helix domain-containing protein [Actinomycetes]WKX15004.1 helix-turn-helix domain-containing protein [Kutzneria buriramensis]GCB51942.1 fis family two component, sigma54 specific [Streptomyces sp. NL15-2K]
MTTAERPSVRSGLASLRRARELFLLGRQLPDGAPEEVVAAWKRARFFGVRHDVKDPAPEHSVRPPVSPLLTAARPVLERIAPALGIGRSTLVLTDERPRVLWVTGFAPEGLRRLDLSEQLVGHNSAVLALRTGRRAEVHGPEHFLDLWQEVSAVSVPVRAPETGQMLGTVTVACDLCAEYGPHPGAPLAEAAASAVEAELLSRSRSAERVLLDAYLRAAGEGGRAVVALDGRNRLVSEAAGQLLSPEGLEALERSTVALLRDWCRGAQPEFEAATHTADGTEGGSALDRAARLGAEPDPASDTAEAPAAEPRATSGPADGPDATSGPADGPDATSGPAEGSHAASDPAPSASYRIRLPDGTGCTATLTPVPHLGSPAGAVAVLEPVGHTAVTSAVRTVEGLAGRSVPWRHAVGRAVELTRSPEPLLLVGERGTGKASLARKLVANPLTIDAAESELRGEVDQLVDGHSLLVRHVERLAQADTATLNSLLASHPDVPLLVTYTPGTPPGPCLQRLLDTLAARSVTLPALRERPDDIRELLRALAPRPAPGRPPLTWTLDALRALEQHPWLGNVTELAHLVRALAEGRRTTGPVRRTELPDAVREGPATRPLSPMEQAERAAILEALHRHGGNKARTAAALGIARATLYRKLRGYRG